MGQRRAAGKIAAGGADPGDPPLILSLMGSGIPPEGRQPDAGIIFKPGPNGASYQNYDTFCLGPLGDGTGSIDCILDLGHRFNYNEGGVSLVNGSTAVSGTAIGEWQFEAGVTGYVEILAAQREYKLNFTPLPIADSHGRWPDMIPVPANNPNVPADALGIGRGQQRDIEGWAEKFRSRKLTGKKARKGS